MDFNGTVTTIFEIALCGFTVWALVHEDMFIAFEERIIARFRRRKFKVLEGSKVSKSYYPVKER